MLEILPLQSKDGHINAAKSVDTDHIPDSLAYAALDNERVCALCQFKITEYGGEILSLDVSRDYDDKSVLTTLCMAVLAFIELCGEEYAYFSAVCKDSDLVSAIGFHNDENGRLALKLR